jgi:hypothetical protein
MGAVARQRNGRAIPQPSAQDFFQDCLFLFFLARPLATAAVETAKRIRALRSRRTRLTRLHTEHSGPLPPICRSPVVWAGLVRGVGCARGSIY